MLDSFSYYHNRDILTAEVYGDTREEEEEEESGEDAASATILAAELPREADVAVGRQDGAWCSGTAESPGAHRAHRNLQRRISRFTWRSSAMQMYPRCREMEEYCSR